jgi:hypothetical protein
MDTCDFMLHAVVVEFVLGILFFTPRNDAKCPIWEACGNGNRVLKIGSAVLAFGTSAILCTPSQTLFWIVRNI